VLEAAAQRDSHCSYFFHIERMSVPPLAACDPKLTESDRTALAAAENAISGFLVNRLELRHLDRDVTRTVATPVVHEAVEKIAGIFAGAHTLTADQVSAYRRFASGRLRISVSRQRPHSPLVCFEPDSAAIFLFAEFALLALELNIERQLFQSLLPILVEIQAIYVYRVGAPQSGMALAEYQMPPEAPSAADPNFAVYERRLEQITQDHVNCHTELECRARMHLHLKSAANSFYPP